MPTYEYECTKCGTVLELFQSMKEKPKRFLKTECEQCNNRAPVIRMIGAGAGIIFKGSGFYETDYRSESYKKGAKAEQEAKSDKSGKDGGKKNDQSAAPTKSKEAKTDSTSKASKGDS